MEMCITMTINELSRLEIIKKTHEKQLKIKEAAEILGLSKRQALRLSKRMNDPAACCGVIHSLLPAVSHLKGRACWTMQLLADRCITLELTDSISDETIRRILKKTK